MSSLTIIITLGVDKWIPRTWSHLQQADQHQTEEPVIQSQVQTTKCDNHLLPPERQSISTLVFIKCYILIFKENMLCSLMSQNSYQDVKSILIPEQKRNIGFPKHFT